MAEAKKKKKGEKKKSSEKEDELFGALAMLFSALGMMAVFAIKHLISKGRNKNGEEGVKKIEKDAGKHSGKD